MSQFEKLKGKLNRKPIPNNIRIEEVITLAKGYGCQIKTGGKHPIHIVHVESGTVIPIPHHGRYVEEAYIKELKDLFDMIEGENK